MSMQYVITKQGSQYLIFNTRTKGIHSAWTSYLDASNAARDLNRGVKS